MVSPKATRTMSPKRGASLLSLALFPLALWIVLPFFGVNALLMTLMVLALGQLLMGAHRYRWGAVLVLLGVLLLSGEAELGVRFYPVIINASLALVFLSSLRTTPVIERLARLEEPDLPPSGVRYTRQVTRVWGGFMFANMLMTLMLALWAPLEVWQLYTGAISYGLAAILMGIEWLVRQRVRRAEVNS